MRHNEENEYDQPKGDQEGREPNDQNRDERNQRPSRNRQNNYAQDRWPECNDSEKNLPFSRSEHGRSRRYYEETFNPTRYQFGEQDPRYYAEENRLRRERMWEEQEREARHRERQNQYSSDRWPEQDEYQSRDTANGQHPSRRRYYEEERRRYEQRNPNDQRPNPNQTPDR
jgi:hypothetical protein